MGLLPIAAILLLGAFCLNVNAEADNWIDIVYPKAASIVVSPMFPSRLQKRAELYSGLCNVGESEEWRYLRFELFHANSPNETSISLVKPKGVSWWKGLKFWASPLSDHTLPLLNELTAESERPVQRQSDGWKMNRFALESENKQEYLRIEVWREFLLGFKFHEHTVSFRAKCLQGRSLVITFTSD